MNDTEELNMAEKAYLEENKDKPIEELTAVLKRKRSLIEFALQKLEQDKFEQERVAAETAKKELENPPSVTTAVPKDSPLLKSFARRKEGGVVAMTSAAAQLSDEIAKEKKKNYLERNSGRVTQVRK